MNSFDWENLQKKDIARSAQHKVTSTGKCTLPSEHLSAAELRKLSGEVQTVNVKQPMAWNRFTRLPDTLQAEYLRHIRQEYDPSVAMLSEMFVCSEMSVKRAMKRLGIAPRPFGKRTTPENAKRWAAFLGKPEPAEAEPTVEPVPEVPDACTESEKTPALEAKPLQTTSLTITLDGEFTPETFIETLRKLPFPVGKVRIHIGIQSEIESLCSTPQ